MIRQLITWNWNADEDSCQRIKKQNITASTTMQLAIRFKEE